ALRSTTTQVAGPRSRSSPGFAEMAPGVIVPVSGATFLTVIVPRPRPAIRPVDASVSRLTATSYPLSARGSAALKSKVASGPARTAAGSPAPADWTAAMPVEVAVASGIGTPSCDSAWAVTEPASPGSTVALATLTRLIQSEGGLPHVTVRLPR